jgi:hypothetical protein
LRATDDVGSMAKRMIAVAVLGMEEKGKLGVRAMLD